MRKKSVVLFLIILIVNICFITIIGCSNCSKNVNVSNGQTPSSVKNITNSIKLAKTKEQGLAILKAAVPLSADEELTNAQMEEAKSGYKWDDGSYYMYAIKNKKTNELGDIGSIFLVKKNTSDIYVLDLQNDATGNTLKKYTHK